MLDAEEKAKLGRRLTGALRHAPHHPENFVNVLRQVLDANELHLADLVIQVGDTTTELAERLNVARKMAQPTFENLLDLAGTKINLNRTPERALAAVLGVSAQVVAQRRRAGNVPRSWFEKIQALPDIDETRAHIDSEMQRAIRILAEHDYGPEAIFDLFQRIRTSRVGVKQITGSIYTEGRQLDANELGCMKSELFGHHADSDQRFAIWLSTHLRLNLIGSSRAELRLSPRQVERLRSRYARELGIRNDDPVFRRVAVAAELIDRPLRSSRSRGSAPPLSGRNLRIRLRLLFERDGDEGLTVRLAQLTGLEDRHALDLIKGANAVGEAWWEFLSKVEAELDRTPLSDAELGPKSSSAHDGAEGALVHGP